MKEIQTIKLQKTPRPLDVEDFPPRARTDLAVELFEDGIGAAVDVPFIIVRGSRPGPTLGISAAVHGDELNGIRIIHEVLENIEIDELAGALVCAPIVNVPAYKAGERRFLDGSDLNHAFPGKKKGRTSQQYAWRFSRFFLPALDALIDVHTASEGRINSFYVRADLENETVRPIATAMGPEIILHVKGSDSTLRGAARKLGVPAITVEAGNPSTIQESMVTRGADGVRRVMNTLEMLDAPTPPPTHDAVVCQSSRWLYTTTGGLLECQFGLLDRLEKSMEIAETRDPYGRVTETYKAPHDGIVIGMAQDPVAVPGTRYVHLGQIGDPNEEDQ